jgi:hypothetical protein
MPTQFFDSVVGEDLMKCITAMKFSAFFLLACGVVVKQSGALAGLQAVAIWMMFYVDQVIVSGQPTQDAIPGLLYSSVVGKHTSILYISRAIDSKGSATLKLS